MRITLATILFNPSHSDIDNVKKTFELARTTRHDIQALLVVTGESFHEVGADLYVSTSGMNVGYGNCLNLAAAKATGDVFVYFSARRAKTKDIGWLSRIAEPLRDPNCGMSGCLKSCQYDRIARRPCDIWGPEIHIQGGVFAIRTSVLRENPYSGYFPQVFSDVWQSWNLIKSGYYLANVREISSVETGVGDDHAMMVCDYRDAAALDAAFESVCREPSDINEHCRVLRDLAARANHITEFGVRSGRSTIAFLAGRPRFLRSYDIDPNTDVEHIKKLVPDGTNFSFEIADSRTHVIEPTDLAFIDTDHTYEVLIKELRHNAGKVSRRIVCHDTQSFPGCMQAINDFVGENAQWGVLVHYENNNGLTVLERRLGWPDNRKGL